MAMVQINLIDILNESVDGALAKAQTENTTENRVNVLSGMHQRISGQGNIAPEDRAILQAIEDEIIRLQDES
jgi:hypothetical protein